METVSISTNRRIHKMWSTYPMEWLFSQRDGEWVSATNGWRSQAQSHSHMVLFTRNVRRRSAPRGRKWLSDDGERVGLRREHAQEVMECSLGYRKEPCFVVCSFTEFANPAPSTDCTSVTISCCLLAAFPSSSELPVFLQQQAMFQLRYTHFKNKCYFTFNRLHYSINFYMYKETKNSMTCFVL